MKKLILAIPVLLTLMFPSAILANENSTPKIRVENKTEESALIYRWFVRPRIKRWFDSQFGLLGRGLLELVDETEN